MRECKNQMTIVGTLKSKKVETGTSKGGHPYISMELVVVSKDGDKIHENRVSFWAKESSKLAKGYHTVKEEYKSIEQDGEEAADRIKITGSIEMNEYVSKDGELKTFNNLKGVFVERVTDPNMKDEAGVALECVVLGYKDELDKKTQTMTGRKEVLIYTVGYNSAIHELKNVFVSADLSQQFVKLYSLNSTGRLFIKINNYVELLEPEEKVDAAKTLGFGSQLDNMPEDISKNYVNELLIIGGDMPSVANKFTMEEITEMKKLRTLAQQEKIAAKPVPETAPNGFGSGFDGIQHEQGGFDMPF